MSWLQTQVKIVKFESKIMQVELKKKEWRKRERWPVVCCRTMSSLNWDETLIQISGLLATKCCRFFLLPCYTYWGLGKAAYFSVTVYNIIPIMVPWRNERTLLVATLSSRLRSFRNGEVHPLGTMVQQKGGNNILLQLATHLYWSEILQWNRVLTKEEIPLIALSAWCWCRCFAVPLYSRTMITRTLTGNEKQFDLVGVRVFGVDWIFNLPC